MVAKSFESTFDIHPGEMLKEVIDAYHLGQDDLAVRLGITQKHLSAIVNGKAGITADTAVALERAIPLYRAPYWLSLQQSYDLLHARREAEFAEGGQRAVSAWLSGFDYEELAAMQYVPAMRPDVEAVEKTGNLLSFFGCASVDAWNAVYGETFDLVRPSPSHVEAKPGNALAWLRKGQVQASLWFNKLPRLDRRAFARSLKQIPSAGLRSTGEGGIAAGEAFSRMRERCAASGVMLVSEPAPPSQPVQSALFWSKQAPCIQLNADLETDDEFWFGFACEAERLLEATSKEAIIDMQGNVLEWLAVDDAYGWLMPTRLRCEFLRRGKFSKQAIIGFADELGVAPGVVVGWLQAQGELLCDTPLNALKSRVEYAVLTLEDCDPAYYRR